MKDSITLKNTKEIKIISNPIRMKVLKNYYTIGQPATVKQMAVHMGEVPANIHYHVKKLLEIKVLELHHTESVNGIIAKFYVPTARVIKIEDEADAVDHGLISERELILSNLFDEAKRDFINSMRAADDSDDEGILVSTRLRLTESEYKEVIQYIKTMASKKRASECSEGREYIFFSGVIETEN